MSIRSALAAIALLLCSLPSHATGVFGEGGVGITTPPDSVGAPLEAPLFPGWSSHTTQRFGQYNVHGYSSWINKDVDLLIDGQFGSGPLNPVTNDEANLLLRVLNADEANRFGWSLTDLAMAYEYFADSTPYEPDDTLAHFLLYPGLSDSARLLRQRNHVDIYLTPALLDGNPNGLKTCAAHPIPGFYRLECIDAHEDGGELQWHWNAVSVTDNYGNRTSGGFPQWPLDAALGVVHEFTHLCRESNTRTYGRHDPVTELGEYNELLACASSYLAVPRRTQLWHDVRYAYSLHNWRDVFPCADDPSKGGVQQPTQRYSLWYLFGAYLGYQFHDPQSPEESLLSRWARNVTDWG